MNQQYPIASSLALRNNHQLHVVNNFSSSLLSTAAINENTSRQHKNNGPASPHHLDELAATSILLIRNSNNTSLSFQQQNANNMHKVQLTDNEDGTTENVDVEQQQQQQHDSSVSVHVPPSNSTNATGQPPVPATVDNVTSSSTTNQQSSRSTTAITSPVYHDYAQEEDPTEKLNRDYAGHSSLIAHEDETTRSLANQKLPAKLAAMLSDPDLITCITWLPHGRSWKILNRDIFSSYALPRYFGHTNHSSFVRVVNAWGFRRIVTGPDRDSYYHELFLRGKSGLYSRMKRLPNNNKKSKDLLSQQQQQQQSPRLKGVASPEQQKQLDFYELSKQSPLPENTWQYRPQAMNNGGVGSRASLGAAFGSVPTTAGGGGMSGMMGGGMIPPPPPPSAIAGMGMHPQFGTGAASLYPTMGVASPMMSAAAAPMMASSGWNIPGIQGGASTATAAGMMGMQRHRQPSMSMSIDGSSTTSAAGRGGPPENSIGSSSTNRPQLLAAAAALQQQGSNENTSTATAASISSSSEIQSLMNQNQLLQALLRKTQAAVAAAGVAPGSASAGGAGYPYQYAAQPPADGGNDEMKH